MRCCSPDHLRKGRVRVMKPVTAACLLLAFAGFAHAGSTEQADRQASFQAMAEELGLRESGVRSRDLPGWSKPTRVVVRLDRPERLVNLDSGHEL